MPSAAARVIKRKLALVGLLAAGAALAGEQGKTWTFEADVVGKAPAGFRFGRTAGVGRPGRWQIEEVSDAPSAAKVLAQLDGDATKARYALAVADAPSLKDVRVSVRCKLVAGEVDRACGLVFRLRDENDYYVTRANAIEDNVRLYVVKNGKRQQLASWDGKVAAGVWHTLAAEARGEVLRAFWNGQRVIEARDATLTAAGKVGLWTKADSVTYFDELAVTPL